MSPRPPKVHWQALRDRVARALHKVECKEVAYEFKQPTFESLIERERGIYLKRAAAAIHVVESFVRANIDGPLPLHDVALRLDVKRIIPREVQVKLIYEEKVKAGLVNHAAGVDAGRTLCNVSGTAMRKVSRGLITCPKCAEIILFCKAMKMRNIADRLGPFTERPVQTATLRGARRRK